METIVPELDRTIEQIALGVSSLTGDSFFRSLVLHLAQALHADFAAVARLPKDRPDVAETVAAVRNGRVVDNVEFPLAGTPWEHVLQGKLCVCPRGVARQFPDDALLAGMDIEACAATPLRDASQRAIGLLIVLYRRPIVCPDLASAILRIFAARTAAELDRMAAQQELQARDTLFQELSENAHEIICITARRPRRVLFVNAAFQNVTGRSCEELRKSTRGWRPIIHPEDRRRVASAMRRLDAARPVEIEYRILRPDGAVRWLRHRATPIMDERGRVCRVIEIAEDVTEARTLRQERRRLARQRRQAQRIEVLGTLAAGLAHDFGNILTAIRGFVDLAKTSGNGCAAHPRALEGIESAAREAGEIVSALLDFSRREPTLKAPVDLAELVEEAAHLVAPVLPPSIKLRLDLPPRGQVWIRGDAGPLRRVVLNLALNARDAMSDGGTLRIRVTSQVEAGNGAARSKDQGLTAAIHVEDEGVGIPPAVRARMFDPFFTTKPRSRGGGLGLALAQSVIDEHAGRIEVDSQPGRGTRMRVLLPSCARPPAQPGEGAPAGSPAHVVVAARRVATRAMLASALTSRGYQVTQAVDLQDTLRRLHASPSPPELLVLEGEAHARESGAALQRLRESLSAPRILWIGDRPMDAVGPVLHRPFTAAQFARSVTRALHPPAQETVDHAENQIAACR